MTTATYLQNDSLSLENLVDSVAVLRHVDVVLDSGVKQIIKQSAHASLINQESDNPNHTKTTLDSRRRHNLLVLRRNKHGGHTDKLELDERDDPDREESIDDVDGDPERFGRHLVSDVDLLQPVNQGRSHGPA